MLATEHSAIGLAVDEAAEYFEAADVAAIWLAPSAARVMKRVPAADWPSHFLPCRVPMKDGRHFEPHAGLLTLDVEGSLQPRLWSGSGGGILRLKEAARWP
jgi:hypothetical protein